MTSGAFRWEPLRLRRLLALALFACGCGETSYSAERAGDDSGALTVRSRHPGGHHHGAPRGRPRPPRKLTPLLECVSRDREGYRALFGYWNPSSEYVSVHVGPSNRFLGAPRDRSQPERFDPGRVRGAFTVRFERGERPTWKLGPQTAAATAHSRRCSPEELTTARELERIQDFFEGQYDRTAVVHQFREPADYRVDCVELMEQPSLRGRSHVITPPSSVPPPNPVDPEAVPLPGPSGGVDEDGAARACPAGSIPIRRFALEQARPAGTLERFLGRTTPQAACVPNLEYQHATFGRFAPVQGIRTTLTIEDPQLDPAREHFGHSISQIWLTNPGCTCGDLACDRTNMQTIESGWRKLSGVPGTTFFLFFTPDNYQTYAWDATCPDGSDASTTNPCGFVQTSTDFIAGGTFGSTTPRPGAGSRDPPVGVELNWHKDGDDGNWYLYRNSSNGWLEIGYYPRTLFSDTGLAIRAERAEVGGEVNDMGGPDSTLPPALTEMGSGSFPTDAAFHRRITTLDAGTSDYRGTLDGVVVSTSGLNCYDVGLEASGSEPNMDLGIVYGGAGGNCPVKLTTTGTITVTLRDQNTNVTTFEQPIALRNGLGPDRRSLRVVAAVTGTPVSANINFLVTLAPNNQDVVISDPRFLLGPASTGFGAPDVTLPPGGSRGVGVVVGTSLPPSDAPYVGADMDAGVTVQTSE